MASLAVERYFNYGFKESEKTLFASGQHWAGLGRMQPHIRSFLEFEHGVQAAWPDIMVSFYDEVMRGEHDEDIASLAMLLPSNLDSKAMMARLRDSLAPMRRALNAHEAKMTAVVSSHNKETKESKDAKTEEDAGDVTAALEEAKSMSPAERQALVAKLNQDARMRRDAAAEKNFNEMSAQLLRSSLVVVTDVSAAKAMMESTPGGLQARTVFVDATMPQSRQTGADSRTQCLPPTVDMQRAFAADVKKLPASPVVGHVLVRPGEGSCEELSRLLRVTHTHLQKMVVPVAVPQEYQLRRRPGQIRALAAATYESGGLEFWARAIGRRRGLKAEKPNGDAMEDSDNDEAKEATAAAEAEGTLETLGTSEDQQLLDQSFVAMTDPRGDCRDSLETALGWQDDGTEGAHFQVGAQIAPMARYLPPTEQMLLKVSERGKPQRCRKGQVDPSVIAAAMQTALNASSAPLGTNEALVVLTCGTPEALVAGLVCGYRKIIYIVSSAEEADMMAMPTLATERDKHINYSACATLPCRFGGAVNLCE
jgi:hypothetical protein